MFHRQTSAALDIWIQKGDGYDELIIDLEDLLTGSGGSLGIPEEKLGYFEANVLLSSALQVSVFVTGIELALTICFSTYIDSI